MITYNHLQETETPQGRESPGENAHRDLSFEHISSNRPFQHIINLNEVDISFPFVSLFGRDYLAKKGFLPELPELPSLPYPTSPQFRQLVHFF